jgi:hypothetical protein
MTKYDAIFQWNMSDLEAKTYKIACTWEEQVKRIFPDLQQFSRLPKKGDPRKSNLFRFCWKCLRETRGLLKDDEYKLYVIANLQILKVHQGRVEPNALCGDKAWYRWLVWKKHFDRKSAEMAGDRLQEVKEVDPKMFKDIGLTKRFLFEKCEGDPTLEKMRSFVESPKIRMWVQSQKIAPIYVLLSPWIAKLTDRSVIMKKLQIDPVVYENKIDDTVREFFKKEFHHEYRQ